METVLLVIHLMLVASLIAVVLLQRSEGGALGIGGGGNFMAARGSGNILTRVTTILAGAFFVTSIVLTIVARSDNEPTGVFDNLPANELADGAGGAPEGGVLNLLGGAPAAEETPAIPDDAGGAAPGDEGADAPAADGGGEAAPVGVPGDAGAAAPAASP
ncbi:MAG: preprotein translocase subunit SecG [Alphaproteobacteria bacterium]